MPSESSSISLGSAAGAQPSLEQLREWDRRIVWHPFTQMAEYEPLLIERGEGCLLYDADGRAYIDGVSSLWCNVHGHRHPRLDAAIVEQLGKIAHTTALGASNSTTIRLAKRLVDIAPPGLEHVFFSDNGATAIEVALKMAFQYWRQCDNPRPEKTAYVALADSYHGDTLGAVSVGGVDKFNAIFEPLRFEVARLPAPDMRRLGPSVSPADACKRFLAEAEEVLAEHNERIAALIVEPLVLGAAGMIVQPEGYVRGLRELTRRYDVLLIADEVAVGFGRTGTMFACEQEGVTPDFLCLAKGITGGYLPMAATLATNQIWRAFLGEYSEAKQFFHGHTYGGNPLAAAVAIASLDVFKEEQVMENLPAKIERLRQGLQSIASHPHVGDVRQRGLMVGIDVVRDRQTREPYAENERRAAKACLAARSHGVLLRPLGDTIVVMPPLAISLDQIDTIIAAVSAGIDAATSD